MKTFVTFLFTIAFMIIFSCSSEKKESQNSLISQKKFITIKPEQMDLMDIELGEIKEMIITPIVFANGRVIANPESQASISTLIGGRVEKIYFKEGDFVKKGQTIATLSSLELLNLQQEFYTTLSELAFAKVEFERQKELSKQKVGALADLQLSESKLNALKAKNLSLKAKLNLLGINPKSDTINPETINAMYGLNSPINGRINKMSVHLGKQLQANELAATIINNHKMRAEIYCYER
ncbi:MAG: efflux RND transporter periplasmic adaptor subunit, partial [Cytophagales bacterium]